MYREVTNKKPAMLWLQAAMATAFFSAIMIRQSVQHGRLALPPTFDDVSYFNDGANYLAVFDLQGPIGVLKTYVAGPPHAPISTGAAMAGFALMGIHEWVGAVANAVVLLFFCRLFLAAARELTVTQSTLLLAVLWMSPFAGITLLWFRPDMIASLLVAVGSIYIVTRNDWVNDRRAQYVAAVFCGIALWAKPTIFPLTLALFGAAVGLASFSAIAKREFGRVAIGGAVMFFAAAIIALPYYAYSFDTVVAYIHTVVSGSQADIWVHPLPLKESLRFYLTGYYGKISIGWWLYGGSIAGTIALVLIYFGSDRSALHKAVRVAVLIIITYAAVTVPSFKGPHGFPFAALMLVAGALSLVVIVGKLPRTGGTAFCLLALAISLWQFEWQFTKDNLYVTSDMSSRRRAVVGDLINIIGRDVEGKTVLFSTSSNFSNFSTLEFEYKKDGIVVPNWRILHFEADISKQQKQIPDADVVVAYSPDFGDTIPNLPTASAEFRKQFIDSVTKTGLFSDPALVHDLNAGGDILVFKRRGP